MVKTIILFLALLITSAATYFSYTNLDKMKDTRCKIQESEDRITKLSTTINDTLDTKATRQNELNSDRSKNAQLTNDKESLLTDIKNTQAEIPGLKTNIKAQEEKITDYQGTIDEIKKLFTEMNVNDMSELNDKIKQLENDRITREKELAETQAVVEATNAAIAKLEGQISDSRGQMAERSRGLSQNSVEPQIMAVNNEWGFVVINAGSDQGFRADKPLIVKRGDSFVAKLSITSLQKTQMVADIVKGSTPKGFVVMPGDRVVLLKSNE